MDIPVRRRGRPPGRSGRELLAVARAVFLEEGFAGTTMDQIAARARVSKASLYREHSSKSALFAAVVRDWAQAGRDSMRPHLDRLVHGADTRADLIRLATIMQAAVLSPEVLAMRRLVTSESSRFPDVAAGYLSESWDRNIEALGDALRALGDQDRLRITHPRTAADQLTWLILGPSLNARLLTNRTDTEFDPNQVEDAVDLFLAGYGTSTS